jgi:hypothetical protein
MECGGGGLVSPPGFQRFPRTAERDGAQGLLGLLEPQAGKPAP